MAPASTRRARTLEAAGGCGHGHFAGPRTHARVSDTHLAWLRGCTPMAVTPGGAVGGARSWLALPRNAVAKRHANASCRGTRRPRPRTTGGAVAATSATWPARWVSSVRRSARRGAVSSPAPDSRRRSWYAASCVTVSIFLLQICINAPGVLADGVVAGGKHGRASCAVIRPPAPWHSPQARGGTGRATQGSGT